MSQFIASLTSAQYYFKDFYRKALSIFISCILPETVNSTIFQPKEVEPLPLFCYFLSSILQSVKQGSKRNITKNLLFRTKFLSFFPTDPAERRGGEREDEQQQKKDKKKKKTSCHRNNEKDAQRLKISHAAFEVIF